MRSITMHLGLVLVAAAVAQAPVQPQDAASPAPSTWQMVPFPALEARVGGQWQAHWNPGTKTPDTIYGAGIPIRDWRENTLVEARRHADQALVTYGDLLRLGRSEFREAIGAPMGRSWSFTYHQYYRGLPCIGGRADVRINGIGVIALLGSVVLPIPDDFDTRPTLDQANATARAWLALGQEPTGVPQPEAKRQPRLVIWGDVDAPTLTDVVLAWEIPVSNLDRDGNGPIGRSYIDAHTGVARHWQNDKHDCCFGPAAHAHHGPSEAGAAALLGPPAPLAAPVPTTVTVMAWTRTGQSAIAALVNTPVVGLVVNVPGIGALTTDANGRFTIDIAAPVTINVTNMDGVHNAPIIDTSGNGVNASVTVNPGVNATLQILTSAATPGQAAHPTTQFWLHTANEWVRSIVGNSGQMNVADNVVPTVNIAATCNAFYTNNTVNFYAAGGTCNNTAFSTVIVHEWGHGIDDRYGGISNAFNDGLSEGWGDIFAMYHPLVDNPVVGIGFTTSGGSVRTGLNNVLYTVVPNNPNLDPHLFGQVWMGFAWLLRDNLRTAFGTPQAVAISNTIVIGSVVADATNRASAVVQVFVADDDDGILGNGTPHYAQLSAAAIAKGLPYPQIQVATVSHVPLANTTDRLTPRLLTCTASPVSSGTITDVHVVYAVNGGPPQTRSLIPNGAVNGYQGMLPGILGGTVTYHLEAVHSSGTVVRSPDIGEYSYDVTAPVFGPFTGFYLENFDAGAPGWTHARISGTSNDDWQLGIPNGKNGTSLGVAWADPTAAVSSGGVYGTDLGAGAANGSYPPGMNYYLQSPAINCSGRTSCFLRFRRWLTVEEATYDQATVLVNGEIVWINPPVTHTIDTSWQTVEYQIPMADNNSAAVIRFQLTTDGGLELGGWNIDDVEIGTRTPVPMAAQLQILPEQAAVSVPMTFALQTQGPQPFIFALGNLPGPTLIPGIPPILVGGSTLTMTGFTNALGQFQFGFNAAGSAPAIGNFWYTQVLTLDPNLTLVTSNQFINLFTP